MFSKSRNRKKENIIIIEGLREILKAFESGYHFKTAFFCPEIMSDESTSLIRQLSSDIELLEVQKHVYEKIAYRDNKDGIIIEAVPKYLSLDELKLSGNPLLIVLETIEKPGNLGAIFRTADAAGVDAVLICDLQTDIYHPNIIRSSIGCLFTTQFAVCRPDEAVEFLGEKKISLVAAALQTDVIYFDVDFRIPSAIVLGSEADGLTEIWRRNADKIVKIPMAGIADSLNVSVTAGIMVFEAIRQRRDLVSH